MGFPHRLVQVHASFWMFFSFFIHGYYCPLPLLSGQLSMRIRTRQNDTDPAGPGFTTLVFLLLCRHGEKILSLCVCPGWCSTELARHVSMPLYKKVGSTLDSTTGFWAVFVYPWYIRTDPLFPSRIQGLQDPGSGSASKNLSIWIFFQFGSRSQQSTGSRIRNTGFLDYELTRTMRSYIRWGMRPLC